MDKTNKIFISVNYAGLILWQCYIAFIGYRQAPKMKDIYNSFGGDLSPITQVFLSFGPWFFLIPVLSIVAVFVVLKLQSKTIVAPLIVLIFMVVSTFLMQAVIIESIFAPLSRLGSVI